jgi:hypothetical protein
MVNKLAARIGPYKKRLPFDGIGLCSNVLLVVCDVGIRLLAWR